MPPKWTRKISRAKPGSYYWNTNNIRGSYVPEPPGADWTEENAERTWREAQLEKLAEGMSVPAAPAPISWWRKALGYKSPAKVAPAPPSSNPLSAAANKARRTATRAPKKNYLKNVNERVKGQRLKPLTKYKGVTERDLHRLTGAAMELKEKENIGTDFSQYLDILNKNSGVSDEEKEPFMRDILLLKKLFDGEIKISLGRGFFGSDNLLKGFASEQLAKIKSTINKVVAFARDENPELYTEEEYRIEEGEKGTSVDTVDNSIKKRRADRAALKKPNANTLEEERAVAALKKRNANTLEEERAAAAALKKRNANTLDEERAAAAAVIGLFNGEYQNSPVFPPKKADEELIVEDLNVEELSSRPSTASSLASTSSSNSGGPIRLSRPSSTAPHLGISLPPLGNRSISQKNKKTVAKDLLANGLRNFQESEKIRKKLAKETLRNLLAKLTSINGAQARKRGTQAKKPTKTGGSRRTPR